MQLVRRRGCFEDAYPTAMPIPAPFLPTGEGKRSPNTGTFMAPATRGREAAPPAPTPIREGRMRRGKCCASSSSIGAGSSGAHSALKSPGTSPNLRKGLNRQPNRSPCCRDVTIQFWKSSTVKRLSFHF